MAKPLIPTLLVALLLGACVRETTLDVDLPDAEPYLVVESYLIAGEPYRVSLTRSLDFFNLPDSLPTVTDAQVRIRHAGDTIPLSFSPAGDPQNYYLLGEYRNQQEVPASYNEPFFLEVDWRGTRYTAQCQMLPPITQIDTANFFNDQGDVNIRMEWQDPDRSRINYYRALFDYGNPDGADEDGDGDQDEPMNVADESNDEVFEDLSEGPLRFTLTGFLEDDAGDTLDFTLTHVEQAYIDYINTTEAGNNENSSPFSEPTSIISNVSTQDEDARVLGIFSAYDPVRRRYIIPAPPGP